MDGDGSREAKKLRCSEPDLRVVLGGSPAAAPATAAAGGIGDGGKMKRAEEEEEARARGSSSASSSSSSPAAAADAAAVTRWHHSQDLARKSRYIDAMLAAPMRERDEMTVTFPDVTAGRWDAMMRFLDSPCAARKMNARDVVDVATLYDKYEFVEGRELCDDVARDYFSSWERREEDMTVDVDLLVDLLTVTREANLDAAFAVGIEYVWMKLEGSHSRRYRPPYNRFMFTESHMMKLQPLIRYSQTRQEQERDWLTLAEHNLLSPNFPKEFVQALYHREQQELLEQCISRIVLSGTACNADGSYIGGSIL